MKTQLEIVAASYDRAIDCGRRGLPGLYDNLPERILNDPDYIAYKSIGETGGNTSPGDSGDSSVKDFLSPAAGMNFIDLGCCLNLMLNAYDSWPSLYHGVDISSKTIELLIEFTAKNNIRTGALLCGSIHETPFEDSYFDIGACIGVLEYYKKDFVGKALIEIHRILKRGGRLVLDAPNILSPACRGMMLLEENAGRPDLFDMLPSEFEEMLSKYFNIEKSETAKELPMLKYCLSCKK